MKTHNPKTPRTDMIDITIDLYHTIAARLREEIATSEWFNGSIAITIGDLDCRLVLTAIVYRRDELLPEGPRRPVDDVVPVWWEFHTTDASGPVPNNFSFSELKPFLIDCD